MTKKSIQAKVNDRMILASFIVGAILSIPVFFLTGGIIANPVMTLVAIVLINILYFLTPIHKKIEERVRAKVEAENV